MVFFMTKKIKLAKKDIKVDTKAKDIATEMELRKYVKQSGGFRKDISKENQKIAEGLMKELGRKEPEWDLSLIPIPSPFKI